MAQKCKTEVQVELKSAANQFYEVFSSKAHLIPKACPDKIRDIQVVKGDWKSVGSVKLWTYCLEGNCMSAKETVERADGRNKSITFKAVDGDIMMHMKNVKSTLDVTAKDKGCLVKWTLEYEKVVGSPFPPEAYLSFVTSVSKDIDAYLLNA